ARNGGAAAQIREERVYPDPLGVELCDATGRVDVIGRGERGGARVIQGSGDRSAERLGAFAGLVGPLDEAGAEREQQSPLGFGREGLRVERALNGVRGGGRARGGAEVRRPRDAV